MKNKILVIDSNSLIHRGFHAIPFLNSRNKGVVNAVYGFFSILSRAIDIVEPNCIVACFDFPAKTFRHKEYKEYKAGRAKTPDELKEQFPKVKEVLESFRIPVFEKEGFEADDLIGTIAELTKKDAEVIILSGDKDMLQLIDDNVKVFLLRRGIQTDLYDEKLFVADYGFSSDKLVEYKALMGDSSDNISGAKGIGPKTAATLIKKFETIENIYSKLEKKEDLEGIKERIISLLKDQKENVLQSRFLVEIKRDVDIIFNMESCFLNYDQEEALNKLEEFGFKSLIRKFFKEESFKKEEPKKEKKNLSLW